MGGPPPGPRFSGGMAKLFGDHKAFSANIELQSSFGASEEKVTMPGKVAFDDGKSRFDLDMSKVQGGGMSPEIASQMKTMGMDVMISITRPDKKLNYLVYPGLNAYAEVALQDPDAGKPDSDFKVEITELGKETVDGKACVKNKVVVTDKEGTARESTVWNATELKKFPIKIETTERGSPLTMLFKDVKLAKPEASSFEPPTGATKYENVMTMMQQEMMKRMGGGVPNR
jgi:hypothetical protein